MLNTIRGSPTSRSSKSRVILRSSWQSRDACLLVRKQKLADCTKLSEKLRDSISPSIAWDRKYTETPTNVIANRPPDYNAIRTWILSRSKCIVSSSCSTLSRKARHQPLFAKSFLNFFAALRVVRLAFFLLLGRLDILRCFQMPETSRLRAVRLHGTADGC